MTSNADHWNQRYAGADHWYGTQPNDFLRAHAAALPANGRVLSLGEGEGRNAVFLAERGYRVTALDASAVGLAKAERLARQRGVHIDTIVTDLADYVFEADAWDAIVSIWCHLPPALRRRVHADVVRGLRRGGLLLLEAYRPEQIAFGTGGPKAPELLVTRADLLSELAGLDIVLAQELERDVHEGHGHGGRSAVVQLIARRT